MNRGSGSGLVDPTQRLRGLSLPILTARVDSNGLHHAAIDPDQAFGSVAGHRQCQTVTNGTDAILVPMVRVATESATTTRRGGANSKIPSDRVACRSCSSRTVLGSRATSVLRPKFVT